MPNDGLQEGLDFKVLPEGIVTHGPPVAPIFTGNLYQLGGAAQMLGGQACFGIPPSTVVAPGDDLGMTTGIAQDPAAGSPVTWWDGSNTTPQAGGKTMTAGGTGFAAGYVVGNNLANRLMPGSEPLIFDPLSPGGVRRGGNMHLSGHLVSTGGVFLGGTQTILSPPIDPTNMIATLVVSPRVTITGLPTPPVVGQSNGQPNYAAALIAPYIVSGPNHDQFDTMYGIQVETNVLFDKNASGGGTGAAGSAYGTSIVLYPQVGASTAALTGPPVGVYASVSPVATQGSTNWWTSGKDQSIAAWFDVSPGTNITNATLINLSANAKSSPVGTVAGSITGTLVGIDFSSSLPWAASVNAATKGVAATVSGPAHVIGMLMGYEARFGAATMFGSQGGSTIPGTAAVYAVDIQGSGSLGAIGLPVLTSAPSNPASGFGATFLYKGASSGHTYRITQLNDAGTQRYEIYGPLDTSSAASTSKSTSLPT